eukprot:767713-Hanusia_phi.AAC.4
MAGCRPVASRLRLPPRCRPSRASCSVSQPLSLRRAAAPRPHPRRPDDGVGDAAVGALGEEA